MDVYKATIEDEMDGLYCISLVEEGAVEVDFQMFAKDKELQTFAVQDDEKRLLLGCIMRCDFNIYRRDGDYEYFIRYDRPTIEKMCAKMLRDNTFKAFDLQHNGEILPEGSVEMIQVFIKDSEKGIVPNGFDDCADGSLFGVFKVNDDDIWELCKQGVFNSFSLEGFFTVKQDFNKVKKINKMDKLKTILKKLLLECGSIATDNGILDYEGDEIVIGMDVTINGSAAPDGEYVSGDSIYVVADGKLQEIKNKEDEPAEEETTEEESVEAEDEEKKDEEEEPSTEEETEEPAEEEETTEEEDKTAELEAKIAELETKIAELEAENEELKKKLSEPAVDPIEEEFEKHNEPTLMDKKTARACKMASYLKKN